MTPVLDYQITYLLAYLYKALRSDGVLCSWLDCSPDQVVRGTYRVQPIYEDSDDVFVSATQIPCLAAVVNWSEPDQQTNAAGQRIGVTLWYVFDSPVDDVASDGTPISGPEKAEVWKMCVWDRVCYWLRQESAAGIDLMTDGRIDKLTIGRSAFFPAGHTYGGWRSELTMSRTMAPMSTSDAAALNLISIDIGSDAHLVTPTGPIDEAEVDTSGD